MQITRVTPSEHSEFLDLVNAEIRPDRAKSNAWDDFPIILDSNNLEQMLIIKDEEGRIAAGIAGLIRQFRTSCGNLYVGGVGSVVTRPDCRGRGFSKALQIEMLDLLRRKNVPLAVLWTDQPEIYAGRGFIAAGWEVHVDLDEADFAAAPDIKGEIREFRPEDSAAVEALYMEHSSQTIRSEGDSRRLYSMPGTHGLVLAGSDDVPRAAVFCGKGADFPDYVTEWSGTQELVVSLLARARDRGLARHVLVPVGADFIVNTLVDLGASWAAHHSGYWAILDSTALQACCTDDLVDSGQDTDDPRFWLGTIDDSGNPVPGPLGIAVWGFDSV